MNVALGRSLEQQGELERAIAAYKEAVKRDGHRADAYLHLAILHDRQGKFLEADELYRKAIAENPGNPDIFCDRGYSFYLQRRWAESEMNLKQAIAIKPDHARAHTNLGLVLAHTGRATGALLEFNKAGCAEADVYANLAFCLAMDGKWDEALKNYQLALASDSSSGPRTGRRELESLFTKAGSTQREGSSDPSRGGVTTKPRAMVLGVNADQGPSDSPSPVLLLEAVGVTQVDHQSPAP